MIVQKVKPTARYLSESNNSDISAENRLRQYLDQKHIFWKKIITSTIAFKVEGVTRALARKTSSSISNKMCVTWLVLDDTESCFELRDV